MHKLLKTEGFIKISYLFFIVFMYVSFSAEKSIPSIKVNEPVWVNASIPE